MQERLQKLIATAGIASRRQAEHLITSGKVMVNDVIITELGAKADLEHDVVTVENIRLRPPEKRATYILYKPKGVICSKIQQGNERIVTDFVPHNPVVHPVGRLDKDSEGLILLTNDGTLTYTLTHPSFEHSKEYAVTIVWKGAPNAEPSEAELAQKFRDGVKLSDGKARADHVSIRTVKGLRICTITVHEGRHHLIRRMCASLGYTVTRLQRTAIGKFRDATLTPGQHRRLSAPEITLLSL